MDLIKKDDRWDLYNEDGHKIASTLDGCVNKLSLKNCQDIERGYDLDELVKGFIERTGYNDFDSYSYKLGFQKALELLGDKKFSEEQMKQALITMQVSHNVIQTTEDRQELIQSLQQNEWEVEIEMGGYRFNDDGEKIGFPSYELPKLDADGCLILKRKI